MRARVKIVSIALVLFALFAPIQVESQCVVTRTSVYTSGNTISVTKYLAATAYCQATAVNALSCVPGVVGSTVSSLRAVANTATANPYCNWSCACGTTLTAPHVTIGPSDGLPVELMSFSIE